jgi:hypothetical protein
MLDAFLLGRNRYILGVGRFNGRFGDADHALVWNFDTHCLFSPALRKMLFEKDCLSGIRNQCPHGGEKNFSGAVVRFHTFPHERRVSPHNR